MMTIIVNPWSHLGVSQDASVEQVKQARNALALDTHPDKCPDPALSDQWTARMAAINLAFELATQSDMWVAYQRKHNLTLLKVETQEYGTRPQNPAFEAWKESRGKPEAKKGQEVKRKGKKSKFKFERDDAFTARQNAGRKSGATKAKNGTASASTADDDNETDNGNDTDADDVPKTPTSTSFEVFDALSATNTGLQAEARATRLKNLASRRSAVSENLAEGKCTVEAHDRWTAYHHIQEANNAADAEDRLSARYIRDEQRKDAARQHDIAQYGMENVMCEEIEDAGSNKKRKKLSRMLAEDFEEDCGARQIAYEKRDKGCRKQQSALSSGINGCSLEESMRRMDIAMAPAQLKRLVYDFESGEYKSVIVEEEVEEKMPTGAESERLSKKEQRVLKKRMGKRALRP